MTGYDQNPVEGISNFWSNVIVLLNDMLLYEFNGLLLLMLHLIILFHIQSIQVVPCCNQIKTLFYWFQSTHTTMLSTSI